MKKVETYKEKVLGLFEDESDGESLASGVRSKGTDGGYFVGSTKIGEGAWNKKSFYKDKVVVKGTKVEEVMEIIKEGEQFGLGLYVLEVLREEVKEIEDWVEEAKRLLDVKDNEEFDFEKVEELYSGSKLFRIESEEVKKYQQAIKPIMSWAQEATKFIEIQSNKSKGK